MQKNSELGIFGQYNFNDNISFIGKTRYCGHDENIYISTGIIYYLQKGVHPIDHFISIRFEKLHYDLKWSKYYSYQMVNDNGYLHAIPISGDPGDHGSTLVNAPALSIVGGGEYIYNNFGINTSLGISHYTKLEDDDDDPDNKRNKFFFTISVLYYFNK